MKLCIPYSEKLLDFIRCAAKDFGIEFVSPPPAGRYTAEIGEAFKLCEMSEKQILALGSCAECYYLGADSVLIYDDEDDCPERTLALIKNALVNSSIKMNVNTCKTAELFAFFKEHGVLKLKDYLETRKNFNQTLKLNEEYYSLRKEILEKNSPQNNILVKIYDKNISAAKDLLSLKLLYRLYVKRLKSLDSACISA